MDTEYTGSLREAISHLVNSNNRGNTVTIDSRRRKPYWTQNNDVNRAEIRRNKMREKLNNNNGRIHASK